MDSNFHAFLTQAKAYQTKQEFGCKQLPLPPPATLVSSLSLKALNEQN